MNKLILKVKDLSGYKTIPVSSIDSIECIEEIDCTAIELHYHSMEINTSTYFTQDKYERGYKDMEFDNNGETSKYYFELDYNGKYYKTLQDFQNLKIKLDYEKTIALLDTLD